ncbi:MAG TPA: Gfo/Idh/MocA family oxidoreductase [Pirellulaceae bacterium]|nr:Gfo/Idh/MocA family oxidoreductase [Pirellulaceae bacterium]
MPRLSRRNFLTQAGVGLGGAALATNFVPYTATSHAQENTAPKSPNARWRIGSIGMRYQGSVITREALPFGDVIAICDVDRHVREQARASFGSTAQIYENYTDLLARKDLDVVLIGTPDHWHAKMVIDACRAGKDIYCEKPLTLTVDEGKLLNQVVKETGRVVQIGSWQRSDARFRQAVEMVHAGRIGKLQRVTVVMGKNTVGGPFASQAVPKHFNWNLWQGPTPDVAYIPERSHYTFRWWYEYSGGEMTDSGAHHLDIAQWGIGMQHSGPVTIEGTATYPTAANGYNVAINYHTLYRYANGVELEVLDAPRGEHTRNGIMFEGDAGRLFVNRGTISGRAVETLAQQPFQRGEYQLYAHDNTDRPELSGKIDAIKNHMGNFYDCTLSRKTPISDVVSQHRSATLCHLGNIAQRVGQKLTWDPDKEQFVAAPEADKMLRREQRHGFEIG